MEIEMRGLESQIEKLKESLLDSLRNHASSDGQVSLMKLTCDSPIEAHLTLFVCQQLIDEFVEAATLPLVIVPNDSDIPPLTLAIQLTAFYMACDECSRFLNTTPAQVRQSFIQQAQQKLDGKNPDQIVELIQSMIKD